MPTTPPATTADSASAGARLRAAIFLILAALVLFVGQAGRELLPPDDLREAEIGREVWERGDHVIPTFGGVPFVDKPPGFYNLVAAAYWIRGKPTTLAARLASAGPAFITVGAIFYFGRSILGLEGAALAALLLAFSSRFCRTAHEVLLDNALTAPAALALIFSWLALEAAPQRRKRHLYAVAALALGFSFLVKGFVGPALFGVGFLAYLIASKRIGELRYAFSPLPAAAFLIPALAWLVPFVAEATPDLLYELFVNNQIHRFTTGYESHIGPFYFYLLDIWGASAPTSLLLPFASVAAWRSHRVGEDRRGGYFFMMAAAPLVILSISRAKASVYSLPVYPALALLAAWWGAPLLTSAARRCRIGVGIAATLSLLGASAAVAATGFLGGSPWIVGAAGLAAAGGGAAAFGLSRRGDLWSAAAAIAGLVALSWMLFFTGPIAAIEVNRRNVRPYVEEVLKSVGDRPILLYNPTNRLSGGVSFYRNRTALEVDSPADLIRKLATDRSAVLLLQVPKAHALPPELEAQARLTGAELVVERRIPLAEKNDWLLIHASAGASSPG